MQKYRFLFILCILIYAVLSHVPLSAAYFVVPIPLSSTGSVGSRDPFGRFGELSGENNVFYLIVKTVIANINYKVCCCAVLGLGVALVAYRMWPDPSLVPLR